MAFKILDVNKMITKIGAKVVQNPITFDREFQPTPTGLQSTQIFGSITKDKFKNYGFIGLETVVMHPLVYENLSKINTIFNRVIQKKANFIINDNKMLQEVESGGTGLSWLIENWSKINFNKYKHPKNEVWIDFIQNAQRDIIIIDKVPVIPIAYRETMVTTRKVEESDIDAMYKKILQATKGGKSFQDAYFDSSTSIDFNLNSAGTRKENIQNEINKLYSYFISKLETKTGFFRNSLAGKRLNNVARMVANARPDIPIDSVAIPWQFHLNLFDVFVVSYLQRPEKEEIRNKLGFNEDTLLEDYGVQFDYIYRNAETYSQFYPDRPKLWVDLLVEIYNDNPEIKLLIKRDPGWNADSFWTLKPLIIFSQERLSYEIIMPNFSYSPLGGDSFNSNFVPFKHDWDAIYRDQEFTITGDDQTDGCYTVRTTESIYIWSKEQ